VALDPRSAPKLTQQGSVLRALRRYPEAGAALDRALALVPSSIGVRQNRAIVMLSQGDLAGARRLIVEAPPDVDRGALAVFVATYGDLYWVLDQELQDLVLTLPPSAHDDDRANWALVRAQIHHLRRQQSLARAFADTAQMEFATQLRGVPDEDQRVLLRALALGYLGRKAEAIALAKRGAAAADKGPDWESRPYGHHLLARIYLLNGEPELAMDELESIVHGTYYVTPAWLGVDPTFASLKGNPRFEKLVAGNAGQARS
jgi:tetratricopeptide (TPR) repeat protein